jgi:transcriptional regulator with XRE-family HTH domain
MQKEREDRRRLLEERKQERIETLAERVRFYRLLRRKTMRELASESGCALDTVWRIENGRGGTRSETQHRLADALGVEWTDLIGPAPERPEDVPPAPTSPASSSSRRLRSGRSKQRKNKKRAR